MYEKRKRSILEKRTNRKKPIGGQYTDTRFYFIIVYTANVIIIIYNVTRVVFTITNGAGYNLFTDNSVLLLQMVV